jgi:hypothetical protein
MPIQPSFIAVATACFALTGQIHAAETIKPAPLQGGSIQLGQVVGTGYYTVEPNGFRVVITLTKDQNQPIRFETVLIPGQSIRLSAPRELGSTSEVIDIVRNGDAIVVTKP